MQHFVVSSVADSRSLSFLAPQAGCPRAGILRFLQGALQSCMRLGQAGNTASLLLYHLALWGGLKARKALQSCSLLLSQEIEPQVNLG